MKHFVPSKRENQLGSKNPQTSPPEEVRKLDLDSASRGDQEAGIDSASSGGLASCFDFSPGGEKTKGEMMEYIEESDALVRVTAPPCGSGL